MLNLTIFVNENWQKALLVSVPSKWMLTPILIMLLCHCLMSKKVVAILKAVNCTIKGCVMLYIVKKAVAVIEYEIVITPVLYNFTE